MAKKKEKEIGEYEMLEIFLFHFLRPFTENSLKQDKIRYNS